MNQADSPGQCGAIDRRQLLAYTTATVSLAALFALTRSEVATAADAWTHPFASYATHNSTNPFGLYDPETYSTAPHKHRGSDFNKTGDILVRAVRPGRVVHVGSESFAGGMLGNAVVIQHSDHWSLYAHFQWGSQKVAHSEQVSGGAPLGLMGNTGHSRGAHLHLEIGSGTWNSSRPWAVLQNPYELVGRAPLPGQTPPQEEDDMFNDEDRNLLRAAATARQPFIRIQASGRGIALIGANYFKGLAPSELEASSALMSHHLTVSDATFDQYKALAIGGETSERATIKTEARPLRLYRYKGSLIAVGPGGKHWSVPSDAYRVLLQAVGLVGEVMRDLGSEDNELKFIKQVLSNVAPDPVAQQTADSVLSLPSNEAEALAERVLDGSLV